ncbi:TonB-dependent receptor-like protein [Chitinophaga dinghuensis]|uniref:TonB-dependent receptor-like protein n=1 Tax=Chitinophaga dinghuensis TaxID=1539050 RepID=A0A327VPZ5_9BACT|nr:alpha-2-macroglobulin family protein [Chitinophaga dinghuensis]RAJ76506.1 TonB-dependent receptor-like protein [Chitinophaga dinghuensis]
MKKTGNQFLSATVTARNSRHDSISQMTLRLPGKIPVSPYVAGYEVKAGETTGSYELKSSDAAINVSAERSQDSVFVSISNPSKIPVWFQVYAGNKLVHRGYGQEIYWTAKAFRHKHYTVRTQYIYGGVARKNVSYAYDIPRLLQVSIQAPGIIQPGGKAHLTVNVRDYQNKPVKDADVTAFAYTSKFKTEDPKIPYYGAATARIRRVGSSYIANNPGAFSVEGNLNWARWKSILGLDTLPYFRFFHPEGLIYNFEPVDLDITQVAPFVVKKGTPQIPHMMWIDEDLRYVYGTTTTDDYSFPIHPGHHTIRIRTASEEVIVDSVYIPEGKKTFICLPADKPSPGVRILSKPGTFTTKEKKQIDSNLILLSSDNNYLRYIYGASTSYALPFKAAINGNDLIGPFSGQYLSDYSGYKNVHYYQEYYYHSGKQIHQSFVPAANYFHEIKNGLVRETEAHISRDYFSKRLAKDLSSPPLKDTVMTYDQLEKALLNNLENMSVSHKMYGYTSHLTLLFNNSFRDSIRQIFIYKHKDPYWITLCDPIMEAVPNSYEGLYKVVVLMKNTGYVAFDSLKVIDGYQSIYHYISPKVLAETDTISHLRTRLNEAIMDGTKASAFIEYPPYEPSTPTTYSRSYLDRTAYTDFFPKASRSNTHTLTGKVTDEKKAGLAGVTVYLLGTSRGAITDGNGEYKLPVPDSCTIIFTMLGYQPKALPVPGLQTLDVTLKPYTATLSEVLVTGYATRREARTTGSASSSSSRRGGNLAAPNDKVAIGGLKSTQNLNGLGNAPLLFVDGAPYNGSISDLDPNTIADINVITGDRATALYGVNGVDGVILITTTGKKSSDGKSEEEVPGQKIRLRQNFRDDAFWQPRLRTNENGEASFDVTYPDDITSWKTNALVMTDNKLSGRTTATTKAFRSLSAKLALPKFVLAGDTLGVLTKITNYAADSIHLLRQLKVNDQSLLDGEVSLTTTNIATTPVLVTNTDSLRATFLISNHMNMNDGEYKAIPVLPVGTMETSGKFLLLRGDTSIDIPASGDTSALHLYASTTAMPILLEEVEYLINYKYLCNEQTASKLVALLLKRKWARAMNTPFKHDDMIRKLMDHLEKGKNDAGLWGWWPGNQTTYWITAHVVKALNMASQQGFKTKSYSPEVLRLIVPHIPEDLPNRLSMLETLLDINPAMNIRPYMDTFNNAKLTSYQWLQVIRLQQRSGMPVNTGFITKAVQKTMLGNTYWGDDGIFLIGNRLQTTLQVYRILKAEGGHDDLLRSTRTWILEQRGTHSWRNTYESASILETIWDDVTRENETAAPVLTINNREITDFPYAAALPGNTAVSVRKSGNRTVYFNSWQQHFNAEPVRKDDAFRIRTFFSQENHSGYLKAGEPATLQVSVEVKGEADFVMIEVPIPAGCSYHSKRQGYYEDYREYNYEKVTIFCQHLNKGMVNFQVELMPRYTGTYQLNPARAELMYFPVFYGHEGMKSIRIQ